ncbi:hypothetical protein B9057_04690 [Aestuarium zhoushanense]|nr:hypothetical protein B9057_04690 [Aestuarium zhoushanense]
MSIRLATALTLAATSLQAEPLRIVTDTAPIQSMVQAVVGDLAEVEVLLPAGASPHDYAMRPSDAIALENADVVVWVGHGLTPFLEDPIETLAKDATVVELLDTEGWLPIELDHHDDHDEHDHGAVDPHAWLAPDVQSAWVMTLANTLGQLDPTNAATYQFNATTQTTAIIETQSAVEEVLADVRGGQFVVSHDALGYFERAFDMPAAGAITISDASAPGAAHIIELRQIMQDLDVTCILVDPQTSPKWAQVVAEGTGAKVAMVDPQGAALPDGPIRSTGIMLDIATVLADCLKE